MASSILNAPANHARQQIAMKAPPVPSCDLSQPTRWELLLAAIALCLLIGINAMAVMCWLGAARAASKGEAVLFGSVIFVLIFVAVGVALLALPAMIRYPRVAWTGVAFALGFAPLTLAGQVAVIIRWLRTGFL
jgi:hypothetical protein